MASPPRPIQSRRDLEAVIIANAWRDPDYKKALLKDPKSVVAKELKRVDPSIDLPKDLKVAVHEEDSSTFHLVLPRDPKDVKMSEVVSDDQLEAVAPQTVAVVVAVAAIGAVVGNTVGAVNNVGAGNVVAAGNVATTGNAVANANVTA
ncbi:MAG: NHLP leader peptide family RiPP precursor [Pseudomonadota bacterium]